MTSIPNIPNALTLKQIKQAFKQTAKAKTNGGYDIKKLENSLLSEQDSLFQNLVKQLKETDNGDGIASIAEIETVMALDGQTHYYTHHDYRIGEVNGQKQLLKQQASEYKEQLASLSQQKLNTNKISTNDHLKSPTKLITELSLRDRLIDIGIRLIDLDRRTEAIKEDAIKDLKEWSTRTTTPNNPVGSFNKKD